MHLHAIFEKVLMTFMYYYAKYFVQFPTKQYLTGVLVFETGAYIQ